MSSRSFRVFGTKKDLENIFREFQKNNMIKYYRCGKSDSDKITDITKIDNFGISLSGHHIGNQYLVIEDDESSKRVYNNLKSIMKRYAVSIVNGYMILKNAYDKKEQLRFATISVQSPGEYDLKVWAQAAEFWFDYSIPYTKNGLQAFCG